MGSPTVIPRNDPRARTLLGVCLALSCGFFILEMIIFLCLQARAGESGGVFYQLLSLRHHLFSLGKDNVPVTAAAVGTLIHAGYAGLMSAALQKTWLRSRRLALSVVLLLFAAFQGGLVALAMGNP